MSYVALCTGTSIAECLRTPSLGLCRVSVSLDLPSVSCLLLSPDAVSQYVRISVSLLTQSLHVCRVSVSLGVCRVSVSLGVCRVSVSPCLSLCAVSPCLSVCAVSLALCRVSRSVPCLCVSRSVSCVSLCAVSPCVSPDAVSGCVPCLGVSLLTPSPGVCGAAVCQYLLHQAHWQMLKLTTPRMMALLPYLCALESYNIDRDLQAHCVRVSVLGR